MLLNYAIYMNLICCVYRAVNRYARILRMSDGFCFQNVLYVAAIQLEKAGLDHLLRHILAVDADGRIGRADSIKEMLAIAESSRP